MTDNTTQRIDGIVAEQERVGRRVFEQHAETDKINNRLDGIEETLAVIHSAIVGSYDRDGLRSAVARVESVAETNKQKIKDTTEKIDAVTSEFSTHTVRINVLTYLVGFCIFSILVFLAVGFFGG